jgi:hypothetical protein
MSATSSLLRPDPRDKLALALSPAVRHTRGGMMMFTIASAFFLVV